MSALLGFLKLVRWPNLLFILLTQVLFFYGVVEPVLFNGIYMPREFRILFYLLCLASILIAAAGYIINDYFDLNIDLVNKPSRMVVDKTVSRRWAIFLHMFFSMAGILISFYIGLQSNNWFIGFANIVCVVVLWFYSTTFKKKLLSGNILISMLTAWTVLVVYFFAHNYMGGLFREQTTEAASHKLLRLALLYTSFAFIITLIREVVKDVEDMEGDRKYGCRTMPIVWGVEFSKVFVSIWMIILLALLLIVLFYILQFSMWVPAAYNFLLIIVPAAYALFLLMKSKTPLEFGKLSTWIKVVIFTGILSMILFKFFG
ncbi:geranylgeranylglycerol-phosphate geranylgeranyltransferase [Lacibacter sp. MH-610]|uniref:geranylgeranylglycerol-phosphate geranylgeranyltransferase n=1 Tax=Lacibacter sp. MH-610 TaxID=3020883 RepID=UPI003892C5B8